MSLRKFFFPLLLLAACTMSSKQTWADPACDSPDGRGGKILCYDAIHRNGGSRVTVSSFIPGFEPAKMIDGDMETKWNSGGYPPAWLQIDMRGIHNLKAVCFTPGLKPSPAYVVMEFTPKSINDRPNSIFPVRFTALLQNGIPYCLTLNRIAGRYITLKTLSGPSWVGMREVRVRGWYDCGLFYCPPPP